MHMCMKSKDQHINDVFSGILFVALFALSAIQISNIPMLKSVGISPLLTGIIIGIIYSHTLRNHLPSAWVPGILFSSKQILRFAIILYGFRISFQQIYDVGLEGLTASLFIVISTLIVGIYVAIKFLKMDRDISILVSVGAAICGAAAVLATETVLDSKPYKTAVAVATVVVFGTVAMFLYPALHAMKILTLESTKFGLFTGATVHEVAQVVGAASNVPGASDTAVIVKLTRVMLLAPVLVVIGLVVNRHDRAVSVSKIIPWFAVLFIAVAGFNSLHLLPPKIIAVINQLDTFLLTMAMTALGMETNANKIKEAGFKPLILASLLFIWLYGAGLGLVSILNSL